MDVYATHLPVLVAAVARTSGSVLELGCGEWSTRVLHEMCAARGRRLVSAESDAGWAARFAHLGTSDHQIVVVPDWGACAEIDLAWDVAFVDHAPFDRRRVDVERLREKCTYVVVHDTEEPCYEYEGAFAKFRYRRDFRQLTPWTTVLSDLVPVW